MQGTQYAMPFNTSGPVLFYNKKAFTAAGLDPDKPPTTLAEVRAAAEKLKANGVEAPLGLKTDPDLRRAVDARMANRLFANNGNGRRSRATKAVFDAATGRQIFSWMDGMVKDGLAATNADLGTGSRSTTCSGSAAASHAMAFDTSAALGTIKSVLAAGNDPNVELGVAPHAGPGAGSRRGGVFNQGGELFMVNKSAPEKQAAAWKFLKFLAEPENVTTWAIGTGYIPIRKSSADEHRDAGLLGAEPRVQGRLRPAARRDATPSPRRDRSSATTRASRDASRDAVNSMFLEGTSTEGSGQGRGRRTPPPRSTTTTPASAPDPARGAASAMLGPASG